MGVPSALLGGGIKSGGHCPLGGQLLFSFFSKRFLVSSVDIFMKIRKLLIKSSVDFHLAKCSGGDG